MLLLNIIVLAMEVLYYSLFMKFAKKEGKLYRYILLFILFSIITLFLNKSFIINYLLICLFILYGFPRAYSIVMDITWKEAYKEICKSAMEQGQMMDNAIFVRSFLDNKFKRIPYIETYIGEFAENHPIGKYLITTNNHITACVNGYVIDTWDCTNKKIEYIWKID